MQYIVDEKYGRCGDMAADNNTEAEEVIGCYKVNPVKDSYCSKRF